VVPLVPLVVQLVPLVVPLSADGPATLSFNFSIRGKVRSRLGQMHGSRTASWQLKHDTAERLPTSDTILSKRGLSPGPSRQHLSDKRSRSDGSAPVDQHQSAAGEELNASPTWDHQLSTDDKYCVQIQTMLSAHCDDTWYSAGPCPHSESVGSELVQIEACIP
jgi:hypothetical protein